MAQFVRFKVIAEPSHLDTVNAAKADEERLLWNVTPVGSGFMADVSRTYEV